MVSRHLSPVNQPRRGVTLIEALVVVAITGLLVALLLPALQSAREASRRARCTSQMKNIGVAIHHHVESLNVFPSGIETTRPVGASYLLQILPYIEQRALYDSINMAGEALLSNANATALARAPGIFLCPSDPNGSTGAVSYAGNSGRPAYRDEGAFIGRRLAPREIQDGLSQTAGVAEWIVGPGVFVPSPTPAAGGNRLALKHRLRRVFTDRADDLEAFTQACQELEPPDKTLSY